MYQRTRYDLKQELNTIKASGLYKDERVILSSQRADISVSYPPGAPPRDVLNFCSNNYLGLANHPAIIRAAHEALDTHGFGLIESVHPIVPVLFRKFDNDAQLAGSVSKALYGEGIYVIGFSYPVVPKGQARIRVQISAAHTTEHIDACVAAFARVGRAHGIIH